MKERTRLILEAGLESYVETGHPITSAGLYQKYDFGIKPAMIRWELNELSETGYLLQMHISGGRVPTDKAYEWWVSDILAEEDLSTHRKSHASTSVYEFEEFLRKGDWETLVERMSERLGFLSAFYEPESGEFVQYGLKDLCARLDVQEKKEWLEVIEDCEVLPNRLKNVEEWEDGPNDHWPKVFIGESPIAESSHLSIIIKRVRRMKDGEHELFMIAIGPKRMNYRRSLQLFQLLEDVNDGE